MFNDLNEGLIRGWLDKEKSKHTIVGGDTNRRWFALETIQGADSYDIDMAGDYHENEHDRTNLALCYYKTPTSHARSGWFYLSDVQSIEEDTVDRWITIRHPSRTYRLRAPDHAQHDMWYQALTKICDCDQSEDSMVHKSSLLKHLEPAGVASKAPPPTSDTCAHIQEGKVKAELAFLMEMTGNDGSRNRRYNPEKHVDTMVNSEFQSKPLEEKEVLDECNGSEEKTMDDKDNNEELLEEKGYKPGDLNNSAGQEVSPIIEKKTHLRKTTLPSYGENNFSSGGSDETFNIDEDGGSMNKRLGRAIQSTRFIQSEQEVVDSIDGDRNVDGFSEKVVITSDNVMFVQEIDECDLIGKEEENWITSRSSKRVSLSNGKNKTNIKSSDHIKNIRWDSKEKVNTINIGLSDINDDDNSSKSDTMDDREEERNPSYFSLNLKNNSFREGHAAKEAKCEESYNGFVSLVSESPEKDDDLSPDQHFVTQNWDDDSSTSSEKVPKKIFGIPHQITEDKPTDCSFLPDENFVDEDWDDE